MDSEEGIYISKHQNKPHLKIMEKDKKEEIYFIAEKNYHIPLNPFDG